MIALIVTMALTATQATGQSASESGGPVVATPPAAVAAPVTVSANRPAGHATMRCIVEVTGRLRDCKITSESPAGRGFGAATLKTAHLFRVRPATRDGQPVEAVITIPLKWQLSDTPAESTPAPSSRPDSSSSITPVQAPN